ncbi:MAG: Spx/MgsR family RNA polymerase-binding regulatory protein [Bdellovibrionota bacterium]
MKKISVYWHPNCGTCKKAVKYMDDKKISYELIDLREKAPNKMAISTMLKQNYPDAPKRLFNTSGMSYREGGFKDKITQMDQKQMIDALSKDGLLIKRPIYPLENKKGVVGFKENEWDMLFT